MRRRALLIGLGLALTLLSIASAAKYYNFSLPYSQKLEEIAYDSKLRLTMPRSTDDRIVILDIDEKSLKEEGRWPWGRDRLALLMDRLFDGQGVAAVGFDVVFAEKDQSSGLRVLEDMGRNQLKGVPQFRAALEKLRPQLEYDQVFAEKIKNRKVVLGYYFTESGDGSKGNVSGALPEAAFPPGTFNGRSITFTHWDGYGANLPELQHSAAGAGHFNPIMDEDGVVRRVPMILEYNGAYNESLSLAVVRAVLGESRLVPGYASGNNAAYPGLEWMEVQSPHGNLKIPVDREVTTLVPYRGSRGSFPYVSVTDVLHDRIPPGQLKDKIVLIGTSAPGLQDQRATPVYSAYPGVEVHANMIAGIMDQNIKQKPPYMVGAEVVELLIIGGALSLLLPLLSPIRATLVAGATLGALVGIDFWVWQADNLDLPVAHGLMLIAGLFALNMSYGYFIESRTKRQITSLFGQYVPAELVEEMSRSPETVSMESDSREMTILFSDVRGFTSISERLDHRELSQLMNEFLTPFSHVIYRHRGTIDKYMGDCIMAFWGAPLHSRDHARDAVLAGLEMLRVLNDLQGRFKARGWPELKIGIGVNTGRVSVGNMGSEVRVAYTVMGDAVNLASRLEGITKQYGVAFVVGEATREAVPDLVYRELDLVRVKGKDKPVAIYEPLGVEGELEPARLEELKLFHQALRMYRKQDWNGAELQFYNLERMYPENSLLYKTYTDRIAYFRNAPPGVQWDGVYVSETK